MKSGRAVRHFSLITLTLCSLPAVAELTQNRYIGSSMIIFTNADDSITITVESGNVKVNGADPENVNDPGMPVPVAGIRSFSITGGPDANVIDASGYPDGNSLDPLASPVEINGGDGDDTLIGSSFRNFIDGGLGADTITGGPELDNLDWEPGDGADHFNGGDGIDRLIIKTNSVDLQPFEATVEEVTMIPQMRTISDVEEIVQIPGVEAVEIAGGSGSDILTVLDVPSSDLQNIVFSGNTGDDIIDASASDVGIIAQHRFNDGNDTFIAGSKSITDSLAIVSATSNAVDTFELSEDNGQLIIEFGGAQTATLTVQSFDRITFSPISGNDVLTVNNLGSLVIEEIRAFMANGDDQVNIAPSENVVMNLRGQNNDTGGDTLTVDLLGRSFTDSGATIIVDGMGAIRYDTFENINFINPPMVGRELWVVD